MEEHVFAVSGVVSGKALREAIRQCWHVDGLLGLIGTKTHLKVLTRTRYCLALVPIPWRQGGGTFSARVCISRECRRRIPTRDITLEVDEDDNVVLEMETGTGVFWGHVGGIPNFEPLEQVTSPRDVQARVEMPRSALPGRRSAHWPYSHYTVTEAGLHVEPRSYEYRRDELVLLPAFDVECSVLSGEVGTTVCLADNLTLQARRVFRADHVMLDIHGERESVRFWAPDDPCVLYVMPMGGDVAPRKGSEKAAEESA